MSDESLNPTQATEFVQAAPGHPAPQAASGNPAPETTEATLGATKEEVDKFYAMFDEQGGQ